MILRIILGDQLNPNHSWFKEKNQENFLYVLMEMRSET
ncbi:MAG: cryptochrome/photolyase family protein, partial [Flavobacteriaceae bacterium]|nr:cryptochrome/photolyase family protein [Flavobacteriaceae bacterium]